MQESLCGIVNLGQRGIQAVNTKTNPPYRAEHIGSLLRPAQLIQAHRAFANGAIAEPEFRAIQDTHIRDVVRLQEDVGLESITDGEFRRGSYWSHFIRGVEGFTVQDALYTFRDEQGNGLEFTAPHTEARLRRRGGICTAEFQFLKSTTNRTAKITMPSPPTMHFWRGRKGINPHAYPDLDGFFEDLTHVYHDEIADLMAVGARYIQLDDVPFAMLCDTNVREQLTRDGEDPIALTNRYIRLINDSLQGISEEVTVGLHICRGNYKGRWLSQGGYDTLAEQLFNDLKIDVFFLEYDSPRAGGFSALRYLPKNKRVVLGLVSSKNPELESAADLKRRIDEASHWVPLEQLSISPQCGFASTVAGNPLRVYDQRKKLRLVVETARDIWGQT